VYAKHFLVSAMGASTSQVDVVTEPLYAVQEELLNDIPAFKFSFKKLLAFAGGHIFISHVDRLLDTFDIEFLAYA
jgi:hypothetical protein